MEHKKTNFKRISEGRVSKIVSSISQLTNLTNSSFYEYEDEEIIKLFEQIENELNKSKETLLKANERKRKNKRVEF